MNKTLEYESLTANLGVENLDETVRFYTEILEFNLVMKAPETGELQWVMLSNGNAVIMFQDMDSLKVEFPNMSYNPSKSAITFYVKVKNMHTLYEKLKGSVYLLGELQRTFYGADEFTIMDNNGYILTITEDK
ncbi:MAG: bleomycin resistance family protein [Bacteroidales bacterium]|jgi:uncharacterized glyoxalase superfamily protein PhnB|nr:bleomycin resistance family protein [Bacteroidales bacterium]